MVARMRPHRATVFGEMSALAARTGAINLGQGFPDVDGPDELKEIAIESIRDGIGNQYPPAHGMPVLREAVADHQARWYGLRPDAASGVVVATGASEALVAAVLAFVEAGDEVIVLDPYFDLYGAAIALADGRRVSVPLAPPEPGSRESFRLHRDALAAAAGDRTRMLILNTPHNPTGTVLDDEDLAFVASLAIEHDFLVLSDEAYEHLVFEPARHVPIAALPGMWERTITVGSGGKSFSFTGWKVGWASGPAELIAPVRVVRQHLSYVSSGPFQPAIAAGLGFPAQYFRDSAADLSAKRDRLSRGLTRLGLDVVRCDGTYFVTTDIRSAGGASGTDFCRELPQRAGVVAIPITALSDHHERFDPYVRWTFCKRVEVLDDALGRLGRALG